MSGGASYVGAASMRTMPWSPSSWYRGLSLRRATPCASTLTRCSRLAGTCSESCCTALPSPPSSSDAFRPSSDKRYVAVTVSIFVAAGVPGVGTASSRRSEIAVTVSIGIPFGHHHIHARSNGAAGGACARRLRGRSGCGLEAAVRVEDAIPDCLRVTVVLGRPQERVAAAFSVDGVLPCGERHVSSPIATFPDREADQLETAERASIGFEDHLRVRQLSCRTAFLVRDDLHGHEFACVFGHTRPPMTPRPWGDGAGYVRMGRCGRMRTG